MSVNLETAPDAFPPSRDAALARLAAFAPRAGRAYAETRNEDRGPDDRENVSTLSPYLRVRAIAETDVIDAALALHGRARARKFIDEVFWRTYWKGWLETHPAAWTRFCDRLANQRAELERDSALRARYEAAVSGATGNAAFDTWARELVAYNYLHNHARMWFASIWIFTLGLPWELGAAFFLRFLLDGDPASNTLSWRWVAGLHTRGKTYVAGRENIKRYTAGRLDPGPDLARGVAPLRDEDLPLVPLALHANEDDVDADDLLLVHDDDLGAGTTWRPGARVAFVVPDARVSGGVDPRVGAFVRAIAADCAEVVLDGRDGAAAAETVLRILRERGLRRIAIPYAPVGGTRDALAILREQVVDAGVPVVTIVRAFDAEAWPGATRGFFGLRPRIDAILDQRATAVEKRRR